MDLIFVFCELDNDTIELSVDRLSIYRDAWAEIEIILFAIFI